MTEKKLWEWWEKELPDTQDESDYYLYVKVDSKVLQLFANNVKTKGTVCTSYADVCIDIDGMIKKFTLEEFKELVFPTRSRFDKLKMVEHPK
jgi:hypothetical protein